MRFADNMDCPQMKAGISQVSSLNRGTGGNLVPRPATRLRPVHARTGNFSHRSVSLNGWLRQCCVASLDATRCDPGFALLLH